MIEPNDWSVIEAASWRLASELYRRHPKRLRLWRGHPGGGQYDVLYLQDRLGGAGKVLLNRAGTIQIHERFDSAAEIPWEPTGWLEYLAAEPREFLDRVERAAGLTAPAHLPSATRESLSYRVLAALTATGFKTVHPVVIEAGYIDTSGGDCYSNEKLDQFPIDPELRRVRDDDFYGESGYRFWIPVRDNEPLMAIEQSTATVWFAKGQKSIDLMQNYVAVARDAGLTAAVALSRSLGIT